MNEPLKSVRKCAVCGKEFIIHRGAGYLYKKEVPKTRETDMTKTRKTEYYCGYTCAKKAGWKG